MQVVQLNVWVVGGVSHTLSPCISQLDLSQQHASQSSYPPGLNP